MIGLVQGFGPFSEHDPNPSELLVRALRAEASPADLVTEVLPTSYATVAKEVPELMDRHRPDFWLGVGLAAGRTSLSIETVGVNLAHWTAEEPDADGVVINRQPLTEDGPAAYMTNLPVEEILAGWRQAGIPGYVSMTAGSYLCNMSLYTAARAAEQLGHHCTIGFLHVPLLPDGVTDPARQPSMAMDLQSVGLDIVIDACRGATGPDGRPALP
jgi:pyroglutamyl-peptidase